MWQVVYYRLGAFRSIVAPTRKAVLSHINPANPWRLRDATGWCDASPNWETEWNISTPVLAACEQASVRWFEQRKK
jgi:hypothetical protein